SSASATAAVVAYHHRAARDGANLALTLWSVEELPGMSHRVSGRWPLLHRSGMTAGITIIALYAVLIWGFGAQSQVVLASGLVTQFCLSMVYAPTVHHGFWCTLALGVIGGYLFHGFAIAPPLAIAAFTA